MLFRTSIVVAALVLSACGSDPVSTVDPAATDSPFDVSQAQSDVLDAIDATDAQGDPNEESDIVGLPDVPNPDEEFGTFSGLVYQILVPAEGPKPSAGSVVTLHYVGTLTDGTVFDSSYSRGAPATFALTNTIEGFKEGVQLMSVGSRYRFTMPANLAYGDQGVGDVIGPDETLIFEVILLEINS